MSYKRFSRYLCLILLTTFLASTGFAEFPAVAAPSQFNAHPGLSNFLAGSNPSSPADHKLNNLNLFGNYQLFGINQGNYLNFFLQSGPQLITDEDSTRAIALQTDTWKQEPFSPVSITTDNHLAPYIRITFFGYNLGLLPGEDTSAITAEARDSNNQMYTLTPEYVGTVQDFPWMNLLVLRFNDDPGDIGDLLVRITLRGETSNSVRIGIGHVGGGPLDDSHPSPSPFPIKPIVTPIPTSAPTPTPTETTAPQVPPVPTVAPQPTTLPNGRLSRYTGNPLIPMGPQNYDQDKTGPRVVLKEGANNYRMWYEAVSGPNKATVGYAISADGINWSKRGTVLSPSTNWEGGTDGEISPNSIIIENGTYKLWYHSFGSDRKRRIGYATSSDGLNWTKYPTPILDVGPAGSADDLYVVEPRVFKLGNQYRMYYGVNRAADGLDAGKSYLMHATSSDGINWTKGNQVLFGPADPGFAIIQNNGVWHMWFGRANNSIGYASSTDGFNWVEGPVKEVLAPSSDPSAPDSGGTGDSVSVYRDNDQYRIMYTGGRYNSFGRIEAICLATINASVSGGPPPAAPTPAPTLVPTPTQTPTPIPVVPPPPVVVPPPSAGSQYYVSPTGSPSGDGSQSRPWNLATALAQPAKVKPGDTIWLRGGTYYGVFYSDLTGSTSAPIIVRQFPGERATLDSVNNSNAENSTLSINGSDTWYWDFEITDSETQRTSRRHAGVTVLGPRTKCINLVVHDGGDNMEAWSSAVDAEFYGNVVYNGGWQEPGKEEGLAHALYIQNQNGTKLVKNNIMFNQYGYGIHAFTRDAFLRNMRFEGNISFNHGSLANQGGGLNASILISGSAPAQGIELINNYTFMTKGLRGTNVNLQFGVDNGDIVMNGNYFVGGSIVAEATRWRKITANNNFFYGFESLVHASPAIGFDTSEWTWNNNQYYSPYDEPLNFFYAPFTYAGWKARTGFDSASTYTRGAPTGAKVVVEPNAYDSKRANIVVYNWDLRSTVNVDLSSIMAPGTTYEVRNAQDFYAPPVLTGTYTGQPVALPMTGLSVARPIGRNNSPAPTGPDFNVFVLIQR